MDKIKTLKSSVFWGVVLWFIGWVLGIIAFMVVPPNMIGWVVSPIGIIIMLWVLIKKIDRDSLRCYFGLGVIWTILAIVLDYIFNVKLFNIAGYYKLDIYIYYALTLLLPIIVGLIKFSKKDKNYE